METTKLSIGALLSSLVLVPFTTLAEINIYESMYSANATVVESKRDKVIVYDVLSVKFDGRKAQKLTFVGGFDPILKNKTRNLPTFAKNSPTHPFDLFSSAESKLPVFQVELGENDTLVAFDSYDVDFDFRQSARIDDTELLIASITD